MYAGRILTLSLLFLLVLAAYVLLASPEEEKWCISLSCVGEDHLEAEEAKRRAGNPCWGWLATHTYHLPYPMRISEIDVEVKIGPLDIPGREGRLFLEISPDGEYWKIVKTLHVKSGDKYEFKAELEKSQEAEYVRLRVTPPPFTGEWISVDYSAVKICETKEKVGICNTALVSALLAFLALAVKSRL